jgi:hypothetical protein
MPEEQSKPQGWQRHGNTAQWLSALIGLGGVLFLLHQINTIAWQVDANGAFSRQASARLIYMGHMNAGLQYPQYLKPDYHRLKNGDKTTFEQYRWFVVNFLFAYDEIFSVMNDEEWIKAFRYDLPPHLPYICDEKDPDFIDQWYEPTRRMLHAAIEKAKDVPECAARQ